MSTSTSRIATWFLSAAVALVGACDDGDDDAATTDASSSGAAESSSGDAPATTGDAATTASAGGSSTGDPVGGVCECPADGVGDELIVWCLGGQMLMSSDASCGTALYECMTNVAANPGASIYCEWNGLEIGGFEATPGDCDAVRSHAACP